MSKEVIDSEELVSEDRLDLTIVKRHLNIDDFFTDDDGYLEWLIDVANNAVQWQLDNEEAELTKAILHAKLLLIGELYNKREITDSTTSSLPKSYDYLISTQRRYTIA